MMTREFQTYDEPRRARECHECPDVACSESFGSPQSLIEHVERAHDFDVFSHLTE